MSQNDSLECPCKTDDTSPEYEAYLLLAMWSEWQMQRLMQREETPSDD